LVLIRKLYTSDQDLLTAFFRSLSDETITWQNHFGKANVDPEALVTGYSEAIHQPYGYVAIDEIKSTAGPMLEFNVVHTKIVAYGWLTFGEKPEQRFTCSLGIVVADEYQNKGIGTELTKFMIEEARKLEMRKIFLNCYTTNERAFKLYTKLGFEIEGIYRKQEWTKDNVALDLYSMAKFLD
jgi:RimJ/RimL family protein N-acetyltransferase